MIDSSEAVAVEWRNGDRKLLWRHERLPREAIAEIKDIDQSVFGWKIDYGDGRWFCLWVQDCHDPPIYMIDARTFGDAEREFVDAFGEKLGIFIEEHELKDYSEPNHSSDGRPYDSSGINGNEGWKINRLWCDRTLLTAKEPK